MLVTVATGLLIIIAAIALSCWLGGPDPNPDQWPSQWGQRPEDQWGPLPGRRPEDQRETDEPIP